MRGVLAGFKTRLEVSVGAETIPRSEGITAKWLHYTYTLSLSSSVSHSINRSTFICETAKSHQEGVAKRF